jgi:hypothetical protein
VEECGTRVELGGVAAGSRVAEDVRSMSSLPQWKKVGGFGLLWGSLRSGDSWRCGLRMASAKEEGGLRVTRWLVAWRGETMLAARRRSSGKSTQQERGAEVGREWKKKKERGSSFGGALYLKPHEAVDDGGLAAGTVGGKRRQRSHGHGHGGGRHCLKAVGAVWAVRLTLGAHAVLYFS